MAGLLLSQYAPWIMLLSIPSLLVLLYILFNIKLYFARRRYDHMPRPKLDFGFWWFLGHVPLFKSKIDPRYTDDFNTARILREIGEDIGEETYIMFFLQDCWISSCNVPLAAKVLTNHKVFFKEGTDTRFGYVNGVRFFGPRGILGDKGTEIWYFKRKEMDPAFKKKFLKSLVTDMDTMSEKVCSYIGGLDVKKNVDSFEILIRFALEIVCKCGFNYHEDFINNENSQLKNAISDCFFGAQHHFTHRHELYWLPWKFRKEKVRMKTQMAYIRDKLGVHLKERLDSIRAGTDNSNDILSYIIKGNLYNDSVTMDDILDDFFVFLVAGMETTAITLSIALFNILKHPDVYAKLKREVDQVYEGKESLDFEDLNRLVYLEQCIKETLRLDPPVQATVRVNWDKEATVEGLYLPKGTLMLISEETIQRQAKYWPDPLKFDPDRFAPGKKIEPFTFLPFMAGPRSCIGKHFAMMEMKIVLAKLLKKFLLFDPSPELKQLEKIITLTSRPRYGVFVGFEDRE